MIGLTTCSPILNSEVHGGATIAEMFSTWVAAFPEGELVAKRSRFPRVTRGELQAEILLILAGDAKYAAAQTVVGDGWYFPSAIAFRLRDEIAEGRYKQRVAGGPREAYWYVQAELGALVKAGKLDVREVDFIIEKQGKYRTPKRMLQYRLKEKA